MAYPYTLTPVARGVQLRLPHVLSTVLLAYGYMPFFGETFIKDWTEHSGLTDTLVMAGVVTVVERLTVGPFNSTAYRVRARPRWRLR